jgi:hypothetical protein
VSDPKPDLSRLGELAPGLGLHELRCLIYDTVLDARKGGTEVDRHLRQRQCSRQRCKDIFHTAQDRLAGRARPPQTALLGWSGALILPGKQETYLKPGRFDPDPNQAGE